MGLEHVAPRRVDDVGHLHEPQQVLGVSHRAVLVNVVARINPASLPALGEAIGHVDPSLPTIGLAFALADLARLRHQMLSELEPE